MMRRDTCKHGALLTEDCADCWVGLTGYYPQDPETDGAALDEEDD